MRRTRLVFGCVGLLMVGLTAAACAAPGAPTGDAAPAKPPAAAGAAPAAQPPVAPSATAAPPAASPAGKPELPSTPAVDLKVGVLPVASFGPFYIAQERGYFKEVGLNVEFLVTGNVNEALASVVTGQLHLGACGNSAGCFNALSRQTDVRIVADIQSTGKTEKSTGNSALVVRKDLWDSGAIREPKDLVGYPIHTIAGAGSGHYLMTARWLKRLGFDPLSWEWPPMVFPDQFAAMQNKAIEIGVQTEPLLSAGIAREVHQIMATQEEMYPNHQVLYIMYWSGIDRLGPRVGERFMVAYLRGVRDNINAFEHGVDQDAIIQILTEHTTIKDPAVWRQIRYAYTDPNGAVNQAALQSDVEAFRELRVLPGPVDLSPMFDDKYRQFAVQYLGEYQSPR